MVECLLGLKCKDFAMIAADQMNFQGIIATNESQKKIHKVGDKMMMGVIGDQADSTHFVQYIKRNLQLYQLKNSYSLDLAAMAHFARYNLVGGRLLSASSSMSRPEPIPELSYLVNLLLAGYDQQKGGQLYYLDFFGTCVPVTHVGLGFGGLLSMGILDRYHKPDLTEAQAYNVLKLCTDEIHQRFIVQLPKFKVCVVSNGGIKELPPLLYKRFTS